MPEPLLCLGASTRASPTTAARSRIADASEAAAGRGWAASQPASRPAGRLAASSVFHWLHRLHRWWVRRGQPSSERRRFLLLDGGALLAGWAAGERGDTVSNTHTPYSCYKYHGPTTAVLRILLDLPVHIHCKYVFIDRRPNYAYGMYSRSLCRVCTAQSVHG